MVVAWVLCSRRQSYSRASSINIKSGSLGAAPRSIIGRREKIVMRRAAYMRGICIIVIVLFLCAYIIHWCKVMFDVGLRAAGICIPIKSTSGLVMLEYKLRVEVILEEFKCMLD